MTSLRSDIFERVSASNLTPLQDINFASKSQSSGLEKDSSTKANFLNFLDNQQIRSESTKLDTCKFIL